MGYTSTRVILFDIDGTLVSSSSIEDGERRRYSNAICELVGKEINIIPARFAGMVDPEICMILLSEAGLSKAEAELLLPEMYSRMSEIYHRLNKRVTLNRGVRELLAILARSEGLRIGVLTGNLKAIAEEKLALCSIRPYFSEGFYSDRYFDRMLLVADAVGTVVSKYQLKSSEDVVIIGDTPKDIVAANNAHATALGVASGVYSAADLVKAKPNFIFQNLEPTEKLLASLGWTEVITRDGN